MFQFPRAFSQIMQFSPSASEARPCDAHKLNLLKRFHPPPPPKRSHDSRCASVPHRHALGMALNFVGVAYYTGFWFRGEAFHSLYQIIQASRLIVLWNVLYLLGPTTSGERLRERVGKERGKRGGTR